jgi:hypothetical protein
MGSLAFSQALLDFLILWHSRRCWLMIAENSIAENIPQEA